MVRLTENGHTKFDSRNQGGQKSSLEDDRTIFWITKFASNTFLFVKNKRFDLILSLFFFVLFDHDITRRIILEKFYFRRSTFTWALRR